MAATAEAVRHRTSREAVQRSRDRVANAGFLTVNEKRAVVGYQPVEEGEGVGALAGRGG